MNRERSRRMSSASSPVKLAIGGAGLVALVAVALSASGPAELERPRTTPAMPVVPELRIQPVPVIERQKDTWKPPEVEPLPPRERRRQPLVPERLARARPAPEASEAPIVLAALPPEAVPDMVAPPPRFEGAPPVARTDTEPLEEIAPARRQPLVQLAQQPGAAEPTNEPAAEPTDRPIASPTSFEPVISDPPVVTPPKGGPIISDLPVVTPSGRGPVISDPPVVTPSGGGPVISDLPVVTPSGRGPVISDPPVVTPSGGGPVISDPPVVTPSGRGPVISDLPVVTPSGRGPVISDPPVVTPSGRGPVISDPPVVTPSGHGPVISDLPVVTPPGLEYIDDSRPNHGLPLPNLDDGEPETQLTLPSVNEVSNHPPVVSLPWWEPPPIEAESPLIPPVSGGPPEGLPSKGVRKLVARLSDGLGQAKDTALRIVPEPGTAALLALGLSLVALQRRRGSAS